MCAVTQRRGDDLAGVPNGSGDVSRSGRILAAILSFGDRPGDSEEEKLAHHYVIVMGLLMACGGVVWGSASALAGLHFPSTIPFGYVAVTAVNFLVFAVTKNFPRARFVQLSISLLLPFLFQWVIGGFVASGAVMLWGIVAILGSLVFQNLKQSLPWLVAYLLLTIFSAVIDGHVAKTAVIFPRDVVTVFFAVNIAVTSSLTFGLSLYLLAEREKTKARLAEMASVLKKMFGRYLSTEVMNSLVENPAALELGGERRSVTIMMTDLRGFTALAERLKPEQVVQMLNIYFEVMVDVVLKYEGTINEITGDALLVIFGAPREMPDRARRAVATAIAMQNAMAEVNALSRQQGLPQIQMGIGLNESEVIVGNIGSSKRIKYAVVGSGVNMTSRIESYTVGGQILISESVRQAAGNVLRIDSQRDVTSKGTDTPLRIYSIGGIAEPYHLALSGADCTMVALIREIPVRYTVLEGKNVNGRSTDASIVKVSKTRAELRCNAPLEILANVRLNLADVDETLSVKTFYGKITADAGDGAAACIVNFTSVPSEIDAYLQAHIHFGSATARETK